MKGSEAVLSKCPNEFWADNTYSDEEKSFILDSPEAEFVIEHELESRNYAGAGKASSDIKLTLKKLGVSPVILRKIAIACYEAEINVVAHSEGGKIIANIYSDKVLIFLEDKGPGIEDIPKAMQPGFSTADDLAREMGFGAGLGLPNIKKNSDVLRITSCLGCKTTLHFLIYYNETNG